MAGVNWRSHGTIEADSLPELCCAVPSRTAAYGNILSSLSGLFICLGLLSLCHSYPLFLSLSLSRSLSLVQPLSLPRPLSLTLSLLLSLPNPLCASLSFSHPLSVFLSPSCLFLSPSVSLSLTLVLGLTFSHSHPLSLFLSLSPSLSLTLCLSLTLHFQLCSYLPSFGRKSLSLIYAWDLNKQADRPGEECLQSKTTKRLLAHMLTHMEEDHNITHEKHYLFRLYYPLI